MSKNIILPQWLDKIIYETFEAVFEPRPHDVVYNPDQPYDFVKLYLGTYFPRSFAEACCIIERLLDNTEYADVLSEIEEINIFDFCCGTGGEIFGMIYTLQSRLPNLKRINIDAVDANPDSVRFLYHLIEEIKKEDEIAIEILINPQCLFIENEQSITDLINIFNRQYHFILSFKALNEFIQSNTFPEENVYRKITEYFLPLLSSNGIFILSDVTTKLNNSSLFYPEFMNKGLNTFVRLNSDYKSIIPHACYYEENNCNGCYMQEVFTVSHSRKKDDITKIAYRIICHADFADMIMQNIKQSICKAVNSSADKFSPYS